MKNYDPTDNDLIIGVAPMSGFAADTMFSHEFESDGFTDVVGVDGDVTRVVSKDTRSTITLSLMTSSLSLDFLSGLYNADRLATGGAGVVPVAIRDKGGSTLFATDTAWIMKMPPIKRGKEPEAIEVKIRCVGGVCIVGGMS
jgi:hypothetical protein